MDEEEETRESDSLVQVEAESDSTESYSLAQVKWTKRRYMVALAWMAKEKPKMSMHYRPYLASLEAQQTESVVDEESEEDSINQYVCTVEDSDSEKENGGGNWFDGPVSGKDDLEFGD